MKTPTVLRVSKAIRNLSQVETILISNLRRQQSREKNAELMLEQAYESAAVPRRMRAASALPPVVFSALPLPPPPSS